MHLRPTRLARRSQLTFLTSRPVQTGPYTTATPSLSAASSLLLTYSFTCSLSYRVGSVAYCISYIYILWIYIWIYIYILWIYIYTGVYIYIYSKEIIISSLLLKHFILFSSLAQTAHVLLRLLRLLAAAPCVPQADRRKRPRRRHHLLGQLRGGTVG